MFTLLGMGQVFAKPLPLIHFAKKSTFQDIELSPDGKYFAASMTDKGISSLVIMNVETKTLANSIKLQEGEKLSYFKWLNNERILFSKAIDKDSHEQSFDYGEVFAMNFDGSKYMPVFGFHVPLPKRPSRNKSQGPIRAWGYVASLLENDDKHFIVASSSWDNTYDAGTSLWRVNAYNAKRKRITLTPFGNMNFILGEEGKPLFASGTNWKGIKKSYFYQDRKWTMLEDSHPLNLFEPQRISEDGEHITFTKKLDNKTRSLFDYEIKSKNLSKLFQDENVDIYTIIYEPENNQPVAVMTMPGKIKTNYLVENNDYVKLRKQLSKSFPNDTVFIQSQTKDGSKVIFLVKSDRNAGDFYLFNTKTKKAQYLVSRKSWLYPEDMAQRQAINYKTRDGVTIHGYLTKPQGKNNVKHPLVVIPHGGPYGIRDTWFYDGEAQMLANNGFAVLQVNFRGSGGYGKEFQEKAYQAGVKLTQLDIIDGTLWAQQLDAIDSDRICIMGASFGGYSALMAPLIKDDLYKCSIAMAGYYDANKLIQGDLSKFNGSIEHKFKELFGDDEKHLKASSPINYIEKLNIPVFIVHGGKDERTPPEQAYLLKDALDKHQKPYEWLFKEKEGHGFYNEKNREEYYKRTLAFLNKHIGL